MVLLLRHSRALPLYTKSKNDQCGKESTNAWLPCGLALPRSSIRRSVGISRMDVSKEPDDHAVQTPLYLLKSLRPPASQTLTLPCLFIRVLEGSLDQCESNQVVQVKLNTVKYRPGRRCHIFYSAPPRPPHNNSSTHGTATQLHQSLDIPTSSRETSK